MQRAHADGLICYAPRQDKRQLLTLIDDWLPDAKKRYRAMKRSPSLPCNIFSGHGPATLEDYVWWSGLTLSDARYGLEMVKAQLVSRSESVQPLFG